MILVLNAIQNAQASERFDRVTVPRLAALAGRAVQIAHLAAGEPLPCDRARTHLLLSGSELSAAEPHERDADVYAVIRAFVEAGKPVLGICWGCQMIAKAFGGEGVCREAKTPEFGWRRVEMTANPLFEGMERIVSAQSHRDEVFDLPEPFRVIASTDACPAQAFQLGDAPVWGIQFHAEIAHGQGRAMFEQKLRADPSLGLFFHDELDDPSCLDENALLFENFFQAGADREAIRRIATQLRRVPTAP